MKLSNSLFLAACCLAAVGCSSTSDSGTDGGGNDGGGGDTIIPPQDTGTKDTATGDTPSDTGQTCSQCATAHCSSQISACTADTQCSKDLDCLNACAGDKTCANACITAECGPDGGTTCAGGDLFNTLVSCVQTNCNTPCLGG